jgi:hypothetical protein
MNSGRHEHMTRKHRKRRTAIPVDLIAPCGMNCRLCWGYVRERNACPGCLRSCAEASQKSKCRDSCRIRNCEHLAKSGRKHCSDRCGHFPCRRLTQLDRRYRARYGMSMLDNLRMIEDLGIRRFIRSQKDKWTCRSCGELLSVHRAACVGCGHGWQ